jgi:hypothetical protein
MSSSLSLQPQASPAALYPSLPPSPERKKSDPTAAPEVKTGLERLNPNQFDWFGLFPQANQHKLSDFLAHPIKSVSVISGIFMTALSGMAFTTTLLKYCVSNEAKKIVLKADLKKELKDLSFEFPVLIGLTFLEYLRQKSMNTDSLKGIQTLGNQATRQEWLDYKKTHPEMSKG